MKKASTVNVLLCFLGWQLIFASYTSGQATYQVNATIKGLADRSVVIRYTRNGMFLEDTVKAHQGQFRHSMAVTDGNIATLVLSPSAQLTVWLESPVVSITGSLSPAPVLKCTGTPENDLLELYRNTIEKPYSLKKKGKSSEAADPIVLQEYQATREFIKQHPATLTAAYLLYWQAIYDITIFDQLDQLLATLSPSVRASYWAQKAVTRIYNVRNKPRIGKKLPAFNLPDATGQMISLDSFKGKYLLIDFWGTWCIPCMEAIPELKAIHAKYGDRIAVLSIALERPADREKWLRVIDKYGMIWPQTAEFTSAKEGVNKLYNLIEYPTLLVADPDGIFVARIKYGESMDEKIQQLLGK